LGSLKTDVPNFLYLVGTHLGTLPGLKRCDEIKKVKVTSFQKLIDFESKIFFCPFQCAQVPKSAFLGLN
tara:strand:- start:434 stop:640 length:207 start_codon:yes stop_codon:yes gene_type:complete